MTFLAYLHRTWPLLVLVAGVSLIGYGIEPWVTRRLSRLTYQPGPHAEFDDQMLADVYEALPEVPPADWAELEAAWCPTRRRTAHLLDEDGFHCCRCLTEPAIGGAS